MAHSWFYWALASAFFAALTAIFAKAGLQGIDSDFATFIRTLVIVAALAMFLSYTHKWQSVGSLSAKNWTFLIYRVWQQVHHGWHTLRHYKWVKPRKWRLWINSVLYWWH